MKLSGNRCLCRGCGKYFNSVAAFDKHRSGPAHARFCQDPAEIGMVKNEGGWWITAPMPLRTGPEWAVSRSGNGKTGDFGDSEGQSTGAGETGVKSGVLG